MEKKSLYKNSIYNVLYKLLNVLYPLVSTSYVAHILLSSGVGKVAYAQNIAQYFVLLAPLGLPNYGTKIIARFRSKQNQRDNNFSELLWINTISTTICVLVYYAFILFSPFFRHDLTLYLVTGLSIVFNYINIDWFYQGTEQFQYITIRSFIVKLISLVALFIFVRTRSDYVAFSLIYVLAIGGNSLFNIIQLRSFHVRLHFRGLEVRHHIRPVVILLFSSLAVEIYTLLDTTMLGSMTSNSHVAYYTNSIKLVKVVISVITAMGGVLLPRLTMYASEGKLKESSEIVNKVFYIMLYLFVPCSAGIMLTAQYIIPVLFGDSFMPAILTLRLSALLVLVLGFSNLFGTQVLLTFDSEKQLLFCTVAGAIMNFSLNLFLIPHFFENGAAVASFLSEFLVTLMTYHFSRRFIKIQLDRRLIISILIGLLAMVAVALVAIKLLPQGLTGLFGVVIVSVATYILTTLAVDPRLIHSLRERS